MVEQLRLVADEKGEILDPSYADRVSKFLDELVWFAKALKEAREKS